MIMPREKLSVDELRNLNEGDYIVVDLRPDCYWEQGEGEVEHVKEQNDGSVRVRINGLKGYRSTLKIPDDGRNAMRLNGAATGARNLPVDAVYRR